MLTRQDQAEDKGALVLIVEDEAEIADIIAAYLERSGFRHARASDGIQGLELHGSLNPDLVLLDIQLPRENGWSVLSKIRMPQKRACGWLNQVSSVGRSCSGSAGRTLSRPTCG